MLSKGKLSGTQYQLTKLMILNKMDKSTSIVENEETHYYISALVYLFIDRAENGNFGKGYTTFRENIIRNEGQYGTIFSWIPIFHLAGSQNHLAISELIFDQIRDISPLIHKWGEIVLEFSICHGHRDMCEFIVNKIPGISIDLIWAAKEYVQINSH